MISLRIPPLLRCPTLLVLAGTALGQNAPPTKSGPLLAETYVVQNVPFAQTISTVGTLRANESVSIVSELSRRLVKIHFQEGTNVAAADLLFKLDDSDLVAELGEVDARIKLARNNKSRAENLRPTESISQQEFEAAAAQLSILEAQRNTKATEIAKTEIHAPFAGRVGIRQVSEGAFVSPSTPLIQLQDVSQIKVDFPLPERYAGEVKPGQKFTFTVAGNGTTFQGAVTVVEPAIDDATRSLQIRGLCTEPKGLLPGAFAEVTLTLDNTANGFMVPSQAIVPSPRGQGVYLIADGKAKLQPVEVGVRTEDQVQILRGLNQGDVIATTNLLRIRPGLEVTPAKP